MKYLLRFGFFILFFLLVGCAVTPSKDDVTVEYLPKNMAISYLSNIPEKYREWMDCAIDRDLTANFYSTKRTGSQFYDFKTINNGRFNIRGSSIEFTTDDLQLKSRYGRCNVVWEEGFFVSNDYKNHRNKAYSALLSLGLK